VAVGHRLAREHGVRLHDAAPVGVQACGGDQVPEQVHAAGDVLALEVLHVHAVAVLEHLPQQLVLAAEVVQHPGVGDADLCGDVHERALVVALRAEHPRGGGEYLLPPVGAGGSLGLRGSLLDRFGHAPTIRVNGLTNQ
jgi:hypothetical protein